MFNNELVMANGQRFMKIFAYFVGIPLERADPLKNFMETS